MESQKADAVVRVGVPPPLGKLAAALFRSAAKVWDNLLRELPAPGFEIREADVDVWLWDAYREPWPGDERPMVAIMHEAPQGKVDGVEVVNEAFVEENYQVGVRVGARATRVLTGSEWSKRNIADHYPIPLDRIDVTPYGIDPELYRPLGEAFDAGYPYVLFVGSVLPRKNLPLLRRAMATVADAGLPHRLVVVALPAPDRLDSSDLLAEASAPIAGREVQNLAGVDDEQLAALMRGADLLCLPSLAEGFGMPVVEAMACGTPVVVSNRGALPEVTGPGGVVVEPTEEALSAALVGLLRDPSRRAELAGLAEVHAAHFTWERMAGLVRRSLRVALDRQVDPHLHA